MTMTTKEKRLARLILKYLSMLLVHLNLLQTLLLFISSISVGRGKLQKQRHSSMMSMFAVLYNFIKTLMTTKLKRM